jgi:hypothetical protein
MTHPGEDALQALMDGELDAGRSEDIRGHLNVCSTCRETLSGLVRADELFRSAIRRFDGEFGAEPVADRRPDVAVLPGPQEPRPGTRPRVNRRSVLAAPLRWAAGIVLVAAGAVSAALALGVPGFDRGDGGSDVAPGVAMTAGSLSGGAAVAVSPVDGSVVVVLSNAGPGSMVRVRIGDGSDVLVDLSGAGEARFQASDGQVTADLAGAPGDVLVEVPRLLGETVIRTESDVLATVRAGLVNPVEAAESGISVGPEQP